MHTYKKVTISLSLVLLSSCSIFTSKSSKESVIESVEEPVTTITKLVEETPVEKIIIAKESTPKAPIIEAEVEELREKIGPFTDEQSSSIVIPEFKNNLLLSDIELKLPEMGDEFHYPVNGEVSSPYGWRRGRMHSGVDIRAPRGTEIHSVFDGVVRFARYNGAYGNCIVVRHYNGLETVYAHATKILVKVNQEVSAGDVIALVGRTGRATGDHLHFEVRAAGQCINPNTILDTDKLCINNENLYITMRKGRVFASNSNNSESREDEIKAITSIKYHIVKSGDTLSRIAANNRTTVSTLCKLNNITSRSILSIGQRVRVQ